MGASESREFLAWYEGQNFDFFNNRRVLQSYSPSDVSVLTEAFQVLRREFIQIRNIDVFLKPATKTSVFNKVLRKLFLKHDTIGLISAGGYSCSVNYSKKSLAWLVYREQTDGCTVLHECNGREYRRP